jgi:hypothetical protein
MINSIVRVAISNNFNCTPAEWAQLEGFAQANPTKSFFINCNAKTPALKTILDHDFKAVITVNPDLEVSSTLENRALAVSAKVAFYRVKWLPDNQAIQAQISRLRDAGHQVVITAKRFAKKLTLLHYTDKNSYKFECSRFRLAGQAKEDLFQFADTLGAQICDRSGGGCRACGLCSRLTTGMDLPLTGLNLSTSGICKYDCPDCYAKCIQKFLSAMGNSITFDVIKANDKQRGRTEHIRRHTHATQA